MKLHNTEVTNTTETSAANDAIIQIGQARMEVAQGKLKLESADRILALHRLRAEFEIIEAVGGEKGLGPNAESRKRSLALGVADNKLLSTAQDNYNQAYLAHEEAKATLESLQNYLKLALVAAI